MVKIKKKEEKTFSYNVVSYAFLGGFLHYPFDPKRFFSQLKMIPPKSRCENRREIVLFYTERPLKGFFSYETTCSSSLHNFCQTTKKVVSVKFYKKCYSKARCKFHQLEFFHKTVIVL